jgi:hypothetical protein
VRRGENNQKKQRNEEFTEITPAKDNTQTAMLTKKQLIEE